jgi:sugar/nucleoside kinase (ribokinase family)
MREARIDTRHVRRHPRLGSGVSVAFSTGGDRGFLSYKGCAWETGALLAAWRPPAFRGLRHVHFAGIRPPFESQLRLLDALRKAGVTTSLDIGWYPAVYSVPSFREVVRRMDVFMPSWRDAQWFTGRATPEEALDALAGLVELPVIKLGPEGAIALSAGRPIRVAPPRVDAVDTTGAGDAFNAGFIWARLRGEPLERCLLAGNICGALSARAAGGTPSFPTLRELRDRLGGRAS